MIIAVASGKGGTGKTTVATNLSVSIGRDSRLIDCDVEEPNCHIFLKPKIKEIEKVGIPVPEIDINKCNFCGECGKFCEFSAIISLRNKTLTFPDLCHGCGGCTLVCPEKAISEIYREIGVVETGQSGNIEFVRGVLNIGEAMSPPLIRAVKKYV
ncbi:MAG: P-loop NTPase, partial [bacterium]|nr:P-loop NTPase [bacterium]